MKKSLLSGAAILMIANAISKIFGAVLKIPLTYILHEDGMAIYNTAFCVYITVMTFSISGVPFAVTKETARENARKNPAGAKTVVHTATILLSALGLVGSVIMWFGAEFLAYAMKEPKAVWAIKAIAPSVFFVALGDGVKAGFQGCNNMLPTAASQCIEAVVKLIAGYGLAVVCIGYGTDIAVGGAVSGVTAGEFIATAILLLWYGISHRHLKCQPGRCREITRNLAQWAYPVLFMSVAGAALSVVDTSLLRTALLRAGFSLDTSRKLYGAYSGYAMTVLNLPVGLLATLGISVIPIVAGALEVGDNNKIRRVARGGLFVAGIGGFLAFSVIAIWGHLILKLLFNNTNSVEMLKISAPSVMFMCLMQFSGAVLQAMGRMRCVFISSVAAGILKCLGAVFLVSVPGINIYGAGISADVAYFVGMVINLCFLSGNIAKKKIV